MNSDNHQFHNKTNPSLSAVSEAKDKRHEAMGSPEMIGPFQLGNCIGKGAFASVFRALNVKNGNIVAMKRFDCKAVQVRNNQGTLPDTKGDSPDPTVEGDELFMDSLKKEIAILAKLSHPNIVSYYDFISTQDHIYLVLEYVENGSLLSSLKAFSGKFPESLVSVYTRQILSGLAYLHSKGVIHCDIKAANLLTTKNGVVKLTDFGVSVRLKATQQQDQNQRLKKQASYSPNAKTDGQGSNVGVANAGKEEISKEEEDNFDSVVGTPFWMAPEVIQMKGPKPASDIWSLGCTVIEMLTGKPPYFDLSPLSAIFRIVEDNEDHMIPSQISPDLLDFLHRCLCKVPEKRATAKQLLRHPFVVGYKGDGDKEDQPSSGHELKSTETRPTVPKQTDPKPIQSSATNSANMKANNIANRIQKSSLLSNIPVTTMETNASTTSLSDFDGSLIDHLANLPTSPEFLDIEDAIAIIRAVYLAYHDSILIDRDINSAIEAYMLSNNIYSTGSYDADLDLPPDESKASTAAKGIIKLPKSMNWIQINAVCKSLWRLRVTMDEVVSSWNFLTTHVNSGGSKVGLNVRRTFPRRKGGTESYNNNTKTNSDSSGNSFSPTGATSIPSNNTTATVFAPFEITGFEAYLRSNGLTDSIVSRWRQVYNQHQHQNNQSGSTNKSSNENEESNETTSGTNNKWVIDSMFTVFNDHKPWVNAKILDKVSGAIKH